MSGNRNVKKDEVKNVRVLTDEERTKIKAALAVLEESHAWLNSGIKSYSEATANLSSYQPKNEEEIKAIKDDKAEIQEYIAHGVEYATPYESAVKVLTQLLAAKDLSPATLKSVAGIQDYANASVEDQGIKTIDTLKALDASFNIKSNKSEQTLKVNKEAYKILHDFVLDPLAQELVGGPYKYTDKIQATLLERRAAQEKAQGEELTKDFKALTDFVKQHLVSGNELLFKAIKENDKEDAKFKTKGTARSNQYAINKQFIELGNLLDRETNRLANSHINEKSYQQTYRENINELKPYLDKLGEKFKKSGFANVQSVFNLMKSDEDKFSDAKAVSELISSLRNSSALKLGKTGSGEKQVQKIAVENILNDIEKGEIPLKDAQQKIKEALTKFAQDSQFQQLKGTKVKNVSGTAEGIQKIFDQYKLGDLKIFGDLKIADLKLLSKGKQKALIAEEKLKTTEARERKRIKGFENQMDLIAQMGKNLHKADKMDYDDINEVWSHPSNAYVVFLTNAEIAIEKIKDELSSIRTQELPLIFFEDQLAEIQLELEKHFTNVQFVHESFNLNKKQPYPDQSQPLTEDTIKNKISVIKKLLEDLNQNSQGEVFYHKPFDFWYAQNGQHEKDLNDIQEALYEAEKIWIKLSFNAAPNKKTGLEALSKELDKQFSKVTAIHTPIMAPLIQAQAEAEAKAKAKAAQQEEERASFVKAKPKEEPVEKTSLGIGKRTSLEKGQQTPLVTNSFFSKFPAVPKEELPKVVKKGKIGLKST